MGVGVSGPTRVRHLLSEGALTPSLSASDADLTFEQTAWGDSGVYYCSVVSAQDLQGNNEAYAELIVLGEWASLGGPWEGQGERALCPSVPSVSSLCPLAHSLGSFPCLLSPRATASHLSSSVPCTPGRDPSPAAFQVSQSQTKNGGNRGL